MKHEKESLQITKLRRLIRETLLRESVEGTADLLYGPALDYFEENDRSRREEIVLQTYNTWSEPVALDNLDVLSTTIQTKILEEYEQEVPVDIIKEFLEELSKAVKDDEVQLSLF